MGSSRRGDAFANEFFPPTPNSSPLKRLAPRPASDRLIGDAFTKEELEEALRPKPAPPWIPPVEYLERDIRKLQPGSQPVTFTGRIANMYDLAHQSRRTSRSSNGGIKLCVKDDTGAITVQLLYDTRTLQLRLGSLVSIWTTRVSASETGTLSCPNAPLFTSLFPERDRNCHLMVHDSVDDSASCVTPLGYREDRPLDNTMTLRNFIEGGHDVIDAKILVVVKSVGAKRGCMPAAIRKDGSTTRNVNVQVYDHTAEGVLGLWGMAALSPFSTKTQLDGRISSVDRPPAQDGWKPKETVLLIQAPGCKIGPNTYLSLTAASVIDVNPSIPEAYWIRNWSIRQRAKQAVNPPFPEGIFDYAAITTGPVRCLYTIAELDEFAREAPNETFQGFLSLLITEVKLLDCWKPGMLLSGDCCDKAIYANALTKKCQGCDRDVMLRLNPRILGQVVDETATIAAGKLILSDEAWRDLLGRGSEELLMMDESELMSLADRLLFCRVTMVFGWTGDESKAGGRICVMGVCV